MSHSHIRAEERSSASEGEGERIEAFIHTTPGTADIAFSAIVVIDAEPFVELTGVPVVIEADSRTEKRNCNKNHITFSMAREKVHRHE